MQKVNIKMLRKQFPLFDWTAKRAFFAYDYYGHDPDSGRRVRVICERTTAGSLEWRAAVLGRFAEWRDMGTLENFIR